MTANVNRHIQRRDNPPPEQSTRGRPRVASEVTRYESPSLTNGRRDASAFWVVTWVAADGTRLTRKFSVSYWGEDLARQKAMELQSAHLRTANAPSKPTPRNRPPARRAENEYAATPTYPKSPEMRYIVRNESSGHAWVVQFKRINNRKYKYFADSLYGGTLGALAAAKAWRDQALTEFDESAYQLWRENRSWHSGGAANAGVSRGVAGCMRSGKLIESPFWRCNWMDADGKRQVRVFSIDTYGEEQAKALAIEARHAGLEQAAREATPNKGGRVNDAG